MILLADGSYEVVPYTQAALIVGALVAAIISLFGLLMLSYKARNDDKDAALKQRDADVTQLVGAVNSIVTALKEVKAQLDAVLAARRSES